MHPLHRRLFVTTLGLTPLLGLATRDASAQFVTGTPQQKAGVLVAPGRPPAGIATPPPKPALPAGCAEPTVAQCTTKATYDGGCFADATKKQAMLDFCTWVIRNEWYKANVTGVTTLFPTSSPNNLTPIITPARKIDRGKNFPAGNQTISPSGRRRFAGTTPPPPPGGVVRGAVPNSSPRTTGTRSRTGSSRGDSRPTTTAPS